MFRRAALIAICLTTTACGGSTSGSSAGTSPSPVAVRFALSGHVTDLATNRPLAGVAVTILDGVNASRTTTSDGAGAFRLSELKAGGFTVRLSDDGYDSVFRGVTFVADTSIDVQMRPARQTLAGTWTGTLSFVPASGPLLAVDVPQVTVTQSGSSISSAFNAAGPYQGTFEGILGDPSSIAGGTSVVGTMTITLDLSGRGPLTCKGSGEFSGSVDWTEMTMIAPRVAFECGIVYTNVRFAFLRQQ